MTDGGPLPGQHGEPGQELCRLLGVAVQLQAADNVAGQQVELSGFQVLTALDGTPDLYQKQTSRKINQTAESSRVFWPPSSNPLFCVAVFFASCIITHLKLVFL